MTARETDTGITALLARAEALTMDLRLEEVARWKVAHPGQLAIGHLPIYMPLPLLEAIGCLPVALFGGGDQTDIIKGDSYFQSYICHLPRSTVELGLNGSYDALDGAIFPSICDVIRNLSGMWKLLFADKYATYMDLPQSFVPEVGGTFYVSEMRRIASDLEARGARPLDDSSLRSAIADENRRRRALRVLDEVRRATPWKLTTSEAYLLARAGSQLTAAAHAAMLEEAHASLDTRQTHPVDNVRVVLVGSFCEQPPLGLLRTLERASCDIIADDLQLGYRYLEADIEEDAEDPLAALCDAYIQHGTACSSRYIADDVKGRSLLETVAECEADGVIFGAPSFCDPALLDQPMLETALQRAGVPYTEFKYAENNAQFQVIREQAGAFSDAVKLWETSP
jgi:benzoyl-CoA reductase subunit C